MPKTTQKRHLFR